jgi:putative nucleotidyltransferase with HDIG domain
MTSAYPEWDAQVERSFKEVLFRFLEEVHCTKAALYLVTPSREFQLVAQYGFGRRERLERLLRSDDPVARKAFQARTRPVVLGDGETPPEVADYLRAAETTRMLLVPLYGGSRVIGLVDARDKGGQQPFVEEDLRQAAVIGAAIVRLALQHGLTGDGAESSDRRAPAGLTPAMIQDDALEVALDWEALQELHEAVIELVAHETVSAVALTAVGDESAASIIWAAGGSGEIDSDAVTRHQAEALAVAGVSTRDPASWRRDIRRIPAATEPRRPSLIASAVPLHGHAWSLALSVVGAEGAAPATTILEKLLRTTTTVRELSRLRMQRRGLARRLLQPGEERFPELVAHSLAVSKLSWSMARSLGMDSTWVEEAALAGLLHDVGMRELEYRRLYRHPAPSPEDRRLYRQHVVIGERILADTGLDGIARAVRHHHERWDGKGYPDRVAGDEIPLLARLVHVAEVYDVLTSTASYRQPIPAEQALAALRSGAGQQFDENLVRVLAGVVT